MKSQILMLMLFPLIAGMAAACTGESQAAKHNVTGVFLETQKQFEDAVGEFDQAIRLDTQFGLAYYNWGQVYLKLENYVSAIEDYDEAIERHPDPALIYTRRGEAHFGLSQYEQSIQDHTEAIRLDPKKTPWLTTAVVVLISSLVNGTRPFKTIKRQLF